MQSGAIFSIVVAVVFRLVVETSLLAKLLARVQGEKERYERERRRRRWPQATTTSPSGVRVHPRANIYAPECRWLKYVLNKGNRAAANPYGLHHVGEWYMAVTGDIFIFLPRSLPTEMRGRESQSYSAMKPSMRGGSGRSRSASARNVSRSFPSSS